MPSLVLDIKVNDQGTPKVRTFKEVTARARGPMDQFGAGTNRMERNLRSMAGQADRVTLRLRGMMRNLAALAGLGGGMMIVRRLAADFTNAASAAEQLRLRLEILTGSVAAGNDLFRQASSYASGVAFEYREILQAATSLKAALGGTNEETMQQVRLAADLATVSGLTIEEASGQIVRAFSAGIGAARLFRERGISNMLGFQAGVTVSAQETRAQIMRIWEDGLGEMQLKNASERLGKTFAGIRSMISDTLFQSWNIIGDAGAFDAVKGEMERLLGWLKKMQESGDLERWGERMANAIQIAGAAASHLDKVFTAMGVGGLVLAARGFSNLTARAIAYQAEVVKGFAAERASLQLRAEAATAARMSAMAEMQRVQAARAAAYAELNRLAVTRQMVLSEVQLTVARQGLAAQDARVAAASAAVTRARLAEAQAHKAATGGAMLSGKALAGLKAGFAFIGGLPGVILAAAAAIAYMAVKIREAGREAYTANARTRAYIESLEQQFRIEHDETNPTKSVEVDRARQEIMEQAKKYRDAQNAFLWLMGRADKPPGSSWRERTYAMFVGPAAMREKMLELQRDGRLMEWDLKRQEEAALRNAGYRAPGEALDIGDGFDKMAESMRRQRLEQEYLLRGKRDQLETLQLELSIQDEIRRIMEEQGATWQEALAATREQRLEVTAIFGEMQRMKREMEGWQIPVARSQARVSGLETEVSLQKELNDLLVEAGRMSAGDAARAERDMDRRVLQAELAAAREQLRYAERTGALEHERIRLLQEIENIQRRIAGIQPLAEMEDLIRRNQAAVWELYQDLDRVERVMDRALRHGGLRVELGERSPVVQAVEELAAERERARLRIEAYRQEEALGVTMERRREIIRGVAEAQERLNDLTYDELVRRRAIANELGQVFSLVQTERDKTRREIEYLQMTVGSGLLNPSEVQDYSAAIAILEQRLTSFGRYAQDLRRDAQDFSYMAVGLSEGIASAFHDAFVNIGRDANSFRDVMVGALEAVAHAVRRAAADLLAYQIRLMMIKALGGLLPGGGAGMMPLPTAHNGGLIDGSFPRMHSGGTVGGRRLRPDELNVTLQRGEYVVSRRGVEQLDRINRGERAGGGSDRVDVRVINQFDDDHLASWANSRQGERVIMNVVRRHQGQG